MSDNHSNSILYFLEVFSPHHSCGVMIATVSFRQMVHEIILQVNKMQSTTLVIGVLGLYCNNQNETKTFGFSKRFLKMKSVVHCNAELVLLFVTQSKGVFGTYDL